MDLYIRQANLSCVSVIAILVIATELRRRVALASLFGSVVVANLSEAQVAELLSSYSITGLDSVLDTLRFLPHV